MPAVRLALEGDLASLLELFACSEVSAHAQPIERARAIWAETIANDAVDVFVATEGERLAATCMLITAPNLLRGGRRHGILDNIVSHPDFRRGGYGRAVVEAALQAAWDKDCFHVLMQSGRHDPAVHKFYRDRGFLPGLRTAYVVHNPALGDVAALIAARPPGRERAGVGAVTGSSEALVVAVAPPPDLPGSGSGYRPRWDNR